MCAQRESRAVKKGWCILYTTTPCLVHTLSGKRLIRPKQLSRCYCRSSKSAWRQQEVINVFLTRNSYGDTKSSVLDFFEVDIRMITIVPGEYCACALSDICNADLSINGPTHPFNAQALYVFCHTDAYNDLQ